MRPYRANVLACNKRVWTNCRSRDFFSFILLHFDWWIGTLNKGFWSSLNEMYRASPRHSPEKNYSSFLRTILIGIIRPWEHSECQDLR
jgi:hypothetical protein